MLKQNWRLVSRFERLGDLALIVLCFFLAYYSRNSLIYWNDVLSLDFPFKGDELAPIKDYFIVLLVGIIAYLIALEALGGYSSMRLISAFHIIKVSLLSSLVVFFSLATVLFALKVDLSRSFIALFCSYVGLTLWFERCIVLRILRFWRRQGRNFRNVLICGIGPQAARVALLIEKRAELGIKIKGFVDLKKDKLESREAFRSLLNSDYLKNLRIIETLSDCERTLEESAIDEVIFADVIEVMPEVEEIVLACSEQGIRTTLVADLFSLGLINSGISYFGDIPLIHFQTPPGDSWQLGFKRLIDIVVSVLVLTFLSPLYLLIIASIWFTSGRPILFIQRRVGLNGRLFYMYKFRSMNVDAHKQLEELKDKNEMDGPVFKLKDDPRVTNMGKFLRRFSLDELPQFYNVLKGEMSLVGPRPPIPGEVSLYERKNRRRLSMRPGLTCTWQVSGRNEINDFNSWVKLDLEYIDNWSLFKDFVLIIKTIPAVIFGQGAR
jgi:exopolysaccharide biosynthesis polyprenyl glycosylphosphotransferase